MEENLPPLKRVSLRGTPVLFNVVLLRWQRMGISGEMTFLLHCGLDDDMRLYKVFKAPHNPLRDCCHTNIPIGIVTINRLPSREKASECRGEKKINQNPIKKLRMAGKVVKRRWLPSIYQLLWLIHVTRDFFLDRLDAKFMWEEMWKLFWLSFRTRLGKHFEIEMAQKIMRMNPRDGE